jgi:hypothetical protein
MGRNEESENGIQCETEYKTTNIFRFLLPDNISQSKK